MRMSQRKVQGGLDVEARSWLGQVTPCVRFATDSRSRRLVAGRWRTEGAQRIPFGAKCLDAVWTMQRKLAPRVVDLVGIGKGFILPCPSH